MTRPLFYMTAWRVFPRLAARYRQLYRGWSA